MLRLFKRTQNNKADLIFGAQTRHLRGVFLTSFLSLGIVICFTPPLYSQSIAEKFGGFSRNSNVPIDIEADQLKVNDVKKTAIFRGNVKAEQDGFVLRSKFLEVYYDGNARAGAQSGANGKVKRLEAKGKVLITTKDKQSATSEWARFDVAKQIITLGDTVVLTQGGNILKGGRLIVNLKTRTSHFENQNQNRSGTKKKKRVQMKIDVSPKTTQKLKKSNN